MKQHEFMMDLTANGRSSCVLMDGTDISGLLRGIKVESDVDGSTTVTLIPARGRRANIVALVPEAQIVVEVEGA